MAKSSTNVSIVKTLAFATVHSAGATLASATVAGADVSYAGTAWTALTVYQSADEVAVKPRKDATNIWPAELPAPVRRYITKAGIESITFGLDEIGTAAFALATDIATSGTAVTLQTTETQVACAIEYRGVGILWMPKCSVDWTGGPDGGLQSQSKLSLTITPYGSSDTDYGWKFYQHSGS